MRAQNQEILGDFKKEIRHSESTLMARDRGTERLEVGGRGKQLLKGPGQTRLSHSLLLKQHRVVVLFAYLAYVSCCSSPKEFAPTSQTFALSNGSGDEVRSDLVCALQSSLFHGKKPLISLVDSISGQTGGTTPKGAMKT